MTKAQEICLAAANLLRERGWMQGDYDDKPGGCLCAVGALHVACGEPAWADTNASRPAKMLVYAALPKEARGIVPYNDAPGRTAEEVIALLERAAGVAP